MSCDAQLESVRFVYVTGRQGSLVNTKTDTQADSFRPIILFAWPELKPFLTNTSSFAPYIYCGSKQAVSFWNVWPAWFF